MDERDSGADRPSSRGRRACGGRHEAESSQESGRAFDPQREARREARHARRSSRSEARHGRKQRVLHTRISERLSEDIKRLAEDLRVPTSNLVRNVLEEVFSVVESVSEDVSDLVDDVLEEAGDARDRIRERVHQRDERVRRRKRHPRDRIRREEDVEDELRRDEASEAASEASRNRQDFTEVIGWQPLVLNQVRTCADCNAKLAKGDRAFVGLTESGLSPHTLCKRCTSERS